MKDEALDYLTNVIEQLDNKKCDEKIHLLTVSVVEGWFISTRRAYPEAEYGILMRYSAVRDTYGVIKKFLSSGMKNGYIQILLDEEYRVIKNSSDDVVMRYFEAEKESEGIAKKFGNKSIILFE